jgi:argonaute-like protein implicated in RNA metabolism and viral defense
MKINAKNYNFNTLYKDPKPQKYISKLSRPIGDPIISVYEDNKKNRRTNPIYRENYGNNNYQIQIIYFYNQMVNQDGIMSDNELIPIVINSKNGRIIGAGWRFTDSIKQISYLERIK